MRTPLGVWATVVALVAGSVVGIAVGRALMETGAPFFSKAPRSSFYLGLAIVPIVALHNAFLALLVGLRRFAQVAVVSIVNAAVQLGAALGFVLLAGLGVNGALLAIVAAGIGSVALSVRYLARAGAIECARITARELAELLSYGARYFVAKLSNVVHFRVGTIVLAFFVAPAEIGLFAAASSLITRIMLVPDAVEMALVARVASDRHGRPALVAQAARVTALIVGPGLVALVLLSGPIVKVLLSPQFLPSLPLIRIIAIGAFARAVTKVLVAYFLGTDRPAVCSWAVALGTVANLVGVLLLLPIVGILGAAWAMTIGYLVSSTIFIVAFRRASGAGLGETWAIRREDLGVLSELTRSLGRRVAWGRGPF